MELHNINKANKKKNEADTTRTIYYSFKIVFVLFTRLVNIWFHFCSTLNQLWDRRHVQTCNHYIVDTRIQWRQKLSGASRPHWRPIWGSVWKRHCAHSLARWDVATLAPNWSLSPLSRLHSLICICHICQKEKTPQWEHDESKKGKKRHKTQTYFPVSSAWMWSVICVAFIVADISNTVFVHEDIMVHLIFILFLHAWTGVHLAVGLSCKKIWCQEQIVIIPSWWQIRPRPLVVIAAVHQLHQLLWLAEPLTVRVASI